MRLGENITSSLGHSLMEQNRTHSRASPDLVIWRIKNILQITYSKLEQLYNFTLQSNKVNEVSVNMYVHMCVLTLQYLKGYFMDLN